MDFESDPRDILNSAHQELDFATEVRPVSEYMPEYRRSLRVCRIKHLLPGDILITCPMPLYIRKPPECGLAKDVLQKFCVGMKVLDSL